MDKARIGLIGLGVMGRNLALNIAEKGFRVAVNNRSPDRIDTFIAEAGELAQNLVPAHDQAALVASLARPRAIILMIKAGTPVDATIASLAGLLDAGDMIIDAGNANFHDTRRREKALARQGISFLGMGVSGGEVGARHGPSIMVGGKAESYAFIRDILEAIAAKYKGDPCAALVGPDGAGHFVKTVHNGIEYADMQLIAEVYGVLRHGLGRPADEIGKLFARWNEGPLQSYLVEITAEILQTADSETGQPIVDVIVDSAGQKGTGRWTVIEALKLGQSPTAIEAAVAARSWSAAREARRHGQSLFATQGAQSTLPEPDDAAIESAMLAAKIIAYSQGFSLLEAASENYDWQLDLARIAEIWRAGCIIRSAMLDDMASAARAGLPHGLLVFAPGFHEKLSNAQAGLRSLVAFGAVGRHPLPAFSAALSYLDAITSERGTANLIQAQRDFFGAHGFERTDGRVNQHGPWAAG